MNSSSFASTMASDKQEEFEATSFDFFIIIFSKNPANEMLVSIFFFFSVFCFMFLFIYLFDVCETCILILPSSHFQFFFFFSLKWVYYQVILYSEDLFCWAFTLLCFVVCGFLVVCILWCFILLCVAMCFALLCLVVLCFVACCVVFSCAFVAL